MTPPWHPRFEKLQQFVLGHLGSPGDPEVSQVEEHLLRCEHCINMAEHAVEFVQVVRQAWQTGNAIDNVNQL
jgi:predicted anti-sigma-YlaC factor YlaD